MNGKRYEYESFESKKRMVFDVAVKDDGVKNMYGRGSSEGMAEEVMTLSF